MYDTIDKENCYKGEPTTNLVDYSEYQYLADNYTAALGGWDTFEGNFLIDVINKVPGYTNRSIKMTSVQANVYKYHFNVPLTSGQTYTVSFWGKATSAGNYGNFLLADGPSGYLVFEPGGYSSVTTEFTRFTYTFVVPSTGTYNFATYLYGDGQVVWLSGFQLENKSHATQYLPSNGAATLRSATQALRPLVNNSSLDLTNVSFDSNAQLYFDGTNDYFDIPYSSTLDTPNGCTYELMVYPSSNGEILSRGSSDAVDNPRLYVETSGNIYWDWSNGVDRYIYSTSNLTMNSWNHLVCTATPSSTLNVYINGQAAGSGQTMPSTLPNTSDAIRIGSSTWVGRYFNGKVSMLKIYNRALTQTEITQNYNSYKSRFNLA